MVRIFSYKNGEVLSGTGFAVTNSADGAVIVTNYHVVDGCDEYELYYNGNGPVQLTLVAKSEMQDLCVLRTAAKMKNLRPLPLYTGRVESGQAVYTLGYPGGADILAQQTALTTEEMTVTNGIVSAVQSSYLVGNNQKPVKLLQTNADINHGNSGGPMLNERGQVVGVNTLGLADLNMSGMNGAIHVQELRGFLEVQGIRYRTGTFFWGIWLIPAAIVLAALVLVWRFKKAKRCAVERQAQAAFSAPGPENETLLQVAAKNEADEPQWAHCNTADGPRPRQTEPVNAQAAVAQPAATLAAGQNAEPAGAAVVEAKRPQKRRRKKRWLIPVIGLPVLLLAAAGGFAWYSYNTYTDIQDAVNYKNYAQVLGLYEKAPWLERWGDTRQKPYSQAMLAVQNHDLDQAIPLFEELGNYADSAEQLNYAQLYQKADKQIDPKQRYKIYTELGNYLDSAALAEKAVADAYLEAKKAIQKGGYRTADGYLKIVPDDYQDSAEYKQLIRLVDKARTGNTAERIKATREVAKKSDELGGVAEPLLMDELLDLFLDGYWYGNGWEFEYNHVKGDYKTNIGFGGSYLFEKGGFWANDKKVVEINYVSPQYIELIYRGYSYGLLLIPFM